MAMEHKIPLFNRYITRCGTPRVLKCVGLFGATVLLSAAGCASRTAIAPEEQIQALEKEVTRLRSERANLEARAGALDDKILLMETRLKKCGPESSSNGLSVVKLRPADSMGSDNEGDRAAGFGEESEEISEEITVGTKRKGQNKRPQLVLNERNTYRPNASIDRKSVDDLAVPSGFAQLGADNLGVVSNGGAAGGAFASDGAFGSAGPSAESGDMALFNNAYREYSNKRLDAALNGFAEFVKIYPNHAFADDALYWRGECYLAQGKFLFAIGELERLTRRYPASDKASSALYRIGFAYDKLRDYAKAAEYYFEVVDRYPASDAARRASRRTAELRNSTAAGGPLLPTSGAAAPGTR